MHPSGVAPSLIAPPAVLGTPVQHPSGWLAWLGWLAHTPSSACPRSPVGQGGLSMRVSEQLLCNNKSGCDP